MLFAMKVNVVLYPTDFHCMYKNKTFFKISPFGFRLKKERHENEDKPSLLRPVSWVGIQVTHQLVNFKKVVLHSIPPCDVYATSLNVPSEPKVSFVIIRDLNLISKRHQGSCSQFDRAYQWVRVWGEERVLTVSVLLLNVWRLQRSHSSLSVSLCLSTVVALVPCDQRSLRLSWWLLSGPREGSSSAECSWRRCVRSDKRPFKRETKMWVNNLTASSIQSRHSSCRVIKA